MNSYSNDISPYRLSYARAKRWDCPKQHTSGVWGTTELGERGVRTTFVRARPSFCLCPSANHGGISWTRRAPSESPPATERMRRVPAEVPAVPGHSPLSDHWTTCQVSGQPENQENQQHQAQESAVVWSTPPCTRPVKAAAAQEHHQQHDDHNQWHDSVLLRLRYHPRQRRRLTSQESDVDDHLERTLFKIGTEPAISLEREIPRHKRFQTPDVEKQVLDAAIPICEELLRPCSTRPAVRARSFRFNGPM